MKRIILPGICVALLSVWPAGFCSAQDNDQINVLGNDAIMMIQQGRADEGLEQLRETVRLAPESAPWRMNLGSMLFSVGSQRYQSGQEEASLPLFEEAREALSAAIDLLEDEDAMLQSQCHFLLGEIAFHVFKQPEMAETHYETALQAWSGHDGARASLDSLKAGR